VDGGGSACHDGAQKYSGQNGKWVVKVLLRRNIGRLDVKYIPAATTRRIRGIIQNISFIVRRSN
jgi:hypothetical protein